MVDWMTPAAIWGAINVLPGIESRVERLRLSRVVNNLAALRFWNNGILEPLKRIATGEEAEANLREIAMRLNQTEARVSKAESRLKNVKGRLVARTLGMVVAHDLDQVVYQKLGPGAIRPTLYRFVETRHCSRDDAAELVRKIDDFNSFLDRVHEAIRPKNARSKAVVRHRRGSSKPRKRKSK